MDVREVSQLFDETIEFYDSPERGSFHTIYRCSYGGRDAILKYNTEDIQRVYLRREYDNLQLMHESAPIDTPAPYDFVDTDGVTALIEEQGAHTHMPDEDDWRSREFQMNIVDDAAHLLNQLHGTTELYTELASSDRGFEYRTGFNEAMFETTDRVIVPHAPEHAEMARRVGRAFQKCFSRGTALRYSHNDFVTQNFGLTPEGEIDMLLDWETGGIFTPMRDVATFEAGIIDEYGRQFLPNEYEALRDRFHSKLNIDINHEIHKLIMYHFVVTSIGYIRNGLPTNLWLKVGSAEEVLSLKEEHLADIRPEVEAILDRYDC